MALARDVSVDGSAVEFDLVEGGYIVATTSNGERQDSISIHRNTSASTYFARKAWPIRILGAGLLLVASPLILLLLIIVRSTSAGPGMYRQERIGRHGKKFVIYKIRTMYDGAERVTGPVWCTPNDSRITPVGKLLRLLHLDELPQLINVARGEMDLIGPRPERPAFVSQLAREIPDYAARLQVLPGVTGLAQINLPPDRTLNCVRKKLLLDCAYIREAGLFLDMRILICTFLRMIGIRHGRAPRWLGVTRHAELIGSERGRESLRSVQERTWSEDGPAATAQFNGHSNCLAMIAVGSNDQDVLDDVNLQAPTDIAALSARRPR